MLEHLDSCNDDQWYGYFSENMGGLALDAPESLFGSAKTTVTNLAPAAAAVGKWGAHMPVRLLGATFSWEKLVLSAAGLGVYYPGAAVGSSAVATGRYLGCGTSMSDVLMQLSRLYPNESFPKRFVRQHPEVIQPRNPNRPHFRMRAYRRLKGLS